MRRGRSRDGRTPRHHAMTQPNEAPVTDRLLALGMDGAPGGWVAAASWGSAVDAPPAALRTELMFFATVREMADWRARRPGGADAPVAVDIPIGLPEVVRYRACDEQARARLPGSRK